MCLYMVVKLFREAPSLALVQGLRETQQTPILLFRGLISRCHCAFPDVIVLLTSIFLISREALHLMSDSVSESDWGRRSVSSDSFFLRPWRLHLLACLVKWPLVVLWLSSNSPSWPWRLLTLLAPSTQPDFPFSLIPTWSSTLQPSWDFLHFSKRRLCFSLLLLSCSCFSLGLHYVKKQNSSE